MISINHEIPTATVSWSEYETSSNDCLLITPYMSTSYTCRVCQASWSRSGTTNWNGRTRRTPCRFARTGTWAVVPSCAWRRRRDAPFRRRESRSPCAPSPWSARCWCTRPTSAFRPTVTQRSLWRFRTYRRTPPRCCNTVTDEARSCWVESGSGAGRSASVRGTWGCTGRRLATCRGRSRGSPCSSHRRPSIVARPPRSDPPETDAPEKSLFVMLISLKSKFNFQKNFYFWNHEQKLCSCI